MIPPDTSSVVPPTDGRELAVTGGLSGLSIGSTFLAMVQSFPASGAVALAGVIVSGAIQVARMWTDKRIERLVSDLNHAHAAQVAADQRERETREQWATQQAADRARIAALVQQLDHANAARERMLSTLLAHSGEVGEGVKQAVAEAVQHSAAPAPAPAPAPTHTAASSRDDILMGKPVDFEPFDTPDPDA